MSHSCIQVNSDSGSSWSTANTAGNMMDTLFCSIGGINLPAEICLRIIELAITENTKDVVNLLRLSRSFTGLITTYEHSLTRTVAQLYRNTKVNQNVSLIVATRPQTRHKSFISNFDRYTFGWLLEVEARANMTREIIHDPFSQCLTPTNGFFGVPFMSGPKIELGRRSIKFKEEALELLYGLADAGKGQDEKSVRLHQIEYLMKLNTAQLSLIVIFVAILGLNYYQKLAQRPPTQTQGHSIKELSVIFEDRLLCHGPIFAWLQTSALTKCNRISLRGTLIWNDWAKEQFDEGIKKLKAFEQRKHREASMICVLWRILYAREDVQEALESFHQPHPSDVYNLALQHVEERMRSYTI